MSGAWLPANTESRTRTPAVDTDDADVADALDALIGVMVERGGVLNPRATITARSGDLRVWCPRDVEENTALMSLPSACLPSVNAATWADDDGRILVEPIPECPPDVLDLLRIHARLFSVTAKMHWFRTEHPRGALAADDPLTQQVRAARPHFTPDRTVAGFLRTRTYRSGGDSLLLGTIDLLNHDRRATGYQRDGAGVSVCISRPTDAEECFVAYGGFRTGPLSRALAYGFLDTSSWVTQSAPMVLRLPGGTVSIGYSQRRPKHRLDPPALAWNGSSLELSHLTFNARHPEFALQTLAMAFSTRGVPDARTAAHDVLAKVSEENISLLRAIEKAAEAHPLRHLGALLAKASAAEQSIIEAATADS